MRKTYSELITIDTLEGRYDYLRVGGCIGHETFGGNRWINQRFYTSQVWKKTRREVIIRDNGCDLAHPDYPISSRIIIHHINPITLEDILNDNDCLYDLDNLVCLSEITDRAIHYGNKNLLPTKLIIRTPNDTKLW